MYLVTGATGQLGLRVVRRCITLGLPVRAFVRLTSQYDLLKEWGAEIFIGDLQQPRDIQAAMAGVEAVICCHGSQLLSRAIQAIDYRATLDVIQAAQEQGVRHVTLISPLAVTGDRQQSPFSRPSTKSSRCSSAVASTTPFFAVPPLCLVCCPLRSAFSRRGFTLSLEIPSTACNCSVPRI